MIVDPVVLALSRSEVELLAWMLWQVPTSAVHSEEGRDFLTQTRELLGRLVDGEAS